MARNALAVFTSAAGVALTGTLGIDPGGTGGCYIDKIQIMIFGGGTWGAQNVTLSNIISQSTGISQTYYLFIPNGSGSGAWQWDFPMPLPYSPVLGSTITCQATAGMAWEAMIQAHFGKISRRGGIY
jgi:hypothetical protein